MTDYPSLPEQGKNLAKFTFEVIKHAMQTNAMFVSAEVKQERLNICKSCEYYDETHVRCRHCGCFLDQKAGFALDSCPIQKWSASDSDWVNRQFEDVMNRIENPQPEPDMPKFPSEANLGETYSWKEHQWEWNGQIWKLVG